MYDIVGHYPDYKGRYDVDSGPTLPREHGKVRPLLHHCKTCTQLTQYPFPEKLKHFSFRSVHLYYLFPSLEEGGLATYRTAIVQNQHLAMLAKVSPSSAGQNAVVSAH